MMDLSKSYEFFKPETCKERIHIIGCGSVGSTVAELLARFGLTKITLYDFDIVEKHNLVNQMFTSEDVGRPKVDAVADMICRINPEAKESLKIAPEGYTNQRLSGYVFLCVDNIELRKEIASKYEGNPFIKAMFDFRTRLTDAQHYAANWSDNKMVADFLNSMSFTREEAKEATPMSACNVALSVAPTLRVVCSYGVSNFINFVSKGEIKKLVLIDAFNFSVNAF